MALWSDQYSRNLPTVQLGSPLASQLLSGYWHLAPWYPVLHGQSYLIFPFSKVCLQLVDCGQVLGLHAEKNTGREVICWCFPSHSLSSSEMCSHTVHSVRLLGHFASHSQHKASSLLPVSKFFRLYITLGSWSVEKYSVAQVRWISQALSSFVFLAGVERFFLLVVHPPALSSSSVASPSPPDDPER